MSLIQSHAKAQTLDQNAIDNALEEGRKHRSFAVMSFLKGLFGHRTDEEGREDVWTSDCGAPA